MARAAHTPIVDYINSIQIKAVLYYVALPPDFTSAIGVRTDLTTTHTPALQRPRHEAEESTGSGVRSIMAATKDSGRYTKTGIK
jgi:hypothetical protein